MGVGQSIKIPISLTAQVENLKEMRTTVANALNSAGKDSTLAKTLTKDLGKIDGMLREVSEFELSPTIDEAGLKRLEGLFNKIYKQIDSSFQSVDFANFDQIAGPEDIARLKELQQEAAKYRKELEAIKKQGSSERTDAYLLRTNNKELLNRGQAQKGFDSSASLSKNAAAMEKASESYWRTAEKMGEAIQQISQEADEAYARSEAAQKRADQLQTKKETLSTDIKAANFYRAAGSFETAISANKNVKNPTIESIRVGLMNTLKTATTQQDTSKISLEMQPIVTNWLRQIFPKESAESLADMVNADINTLLENIMSKIFNDKKTNQSYRDVEGLTYTTDHSGSLRSAQMYASAEINRIYGKYNLTEETDLTTQSKVIQTQLTAALADVKKYKDTADRKQREGSELEEERDAISTTAWETAELAQELQILAESERDAAAAAKEKQIANNSQAQEDFRRDVMERRKGSDEDYRSQRRQYQGDSEDFIGGLRKRIGEETDYEQDAKEFTNNLKQSIKQWMSAQQIVTLVKDGIRQAYQDIQGLDKAMTNIAVVTDMSVGDLWGKINEYMSIAQEYGVTTQGVYEVSQLYYQQGLSTNEVMEATTETLKMARIAGMGYAEAADAMTVAIRSFKMEMSDASHVTDVYSKVAAITASDSEELAIAMSKTASSAESVGSSFENTTAMLAVMIETTRESAQNLGSALKSIISRYGEMKSGLTQDSDGEIIDYNKTDAALRSIGISLKDAQGQFRDFDDVIFELSEKWDSLDKNTQRYIATVMAGNRQQSRFIALVDNWERLEEVSGAAADSDDAGLLQYAKTLDSLETKLNSIKTSFQEFYMNIINGPLIGGVLDAINSLLQGFNKLGSAQGIFSLISIIRGLKTALGSVVNTFSGSFNGIISSWKATQAEWLNLAKTFGYKRGYEEGRAYSEGYSTGVAGGSPTQTTVYSGTNNTQSLVNQRSYQEMSFLERRRLGDQSGVIRESRGASTSGWKTNSWNGSKWGSIASIGGSIAGSVLSSLGAAQAEEDRRTGAVLSGLGNVAQGASMGAMAGPWGAVIGGVIGGLVSLPAVLEAFDPANVLKEKLEKAEEVLKEAELERAQKKETARDLESTIENLKKLQEARYDSEEAEAAFIEASNAAAEKFPELVSSYTTTGDAIVDVIGKAESAELALIEARKNAAQAALEAAQADFVTAAAETDVKENNKSNTEAIAKDVYTYWNDLSANALPGADMRNWSSIFNYGTEGAEGTEDSFLKWFDTNHGFTSIFLPTDTDRQLYNTEYIQQAWGNTYDLAGTWLGKAENRYEEFGIDPIKLFMNNSLSNSEIIPSKDNYSTGVGADGNGVWVGDINSDSVFDFLKAISGLSDEEIQELSTKSEYEQAQAYTTIILDIVRNEQLLNNRLKEAGHVDVEGEGLTTQQISNWQNLFTNALNYGLQQMKLIGADETYLNFIDPVAEAESEVQAGQTKEEKKARFLSQQYAYNYGQALDPLQEDNWRQAEGIFDAIVDTVMNQLDIDANKFNKETGQFKSSALQTQFNDKIEQLYNAYDDLTDLQLQNLNDIYNLAQKGFLTRGEFEEKLGLILDEDTELYKIYLAQFNKIDNKQRIRALRGLSELGIESKAVTEELSDSQGTKFTGLPTYEEWLQEGQLTDSAKNEKQYQEQVQKWMDQLQLEAAEGIDTFLLTGATQYVNEYQKLISEQNKILESTGTQSYAYQTAEKQKTILTKLYGELGKEDNGIFANLSDEQIDTFLTAYSTDIGSTEWAKNVTRLAEEYGINLSTILGNSISSVAELIVENYTVKVQQTVEQAQTDIKSISELADDQEKGLDFSKANSLLQQLRKAGNTDSWNTIFDVNEQGIITLINFDKTVNLLYQDSLKNLQKLQDDNNYILDQLSTESEDLPSIDFSLDGYETIEKIDERAREIVDELNTAFNLNLANNPILREELVNAVTSGEINSIATLTEYFKGISDQLGLASDSLIKQMQQMFASNAFKEWGKGFDKALDTKKLAEITSGSYTDLQSLWDKRIEKDWAKLLEDKEPKYSIGDSTVKDGQVVTLKEGDDLIGQVKSLGDWDTADYVAYYGAQAETLATYGAQLDAFGELVITNWQKWAAYIADSYGYTEEAASKDETGAIDAARQQIFTDAHANQIELKETTVKNLQTGLEDLYTTAIEDQELNWSDVSDLIADAGLGSTAQELILNEYEKAKSQGISGYLSFIDDLKYIIQQSSNGDQVDTMALEVAIATAKETLTGELTKFLTNGIEGKLTVEEYASMAKRLPFLANSKGLQTVDGIALSAKDQQQVLGVLYEEIGQLQGFGDKVLEMLPDGIDSSNISEAIKDANAAAEEAEKEFRAAHDELGQEGKATLDYAKEVADETGRAWVNAENYAAALREAQKALMLNKDAYDFTFMEQDPTDGLTANFDNFLDQIDTVKETFATLKSGEAIDYKDFYNLMDFINTNATWDTFTTNTKIAGKTYEEFVNSVVKNSDEWGKVDIGGITAEMGISVDAAMTAMTGSMEEGLKAVAKEQIKYLEGLETMLTAMAALEGLDVNADIGFNIDYTDGSGEKYNFKTFNSIWDHYTSLPDESKKQFLIEIASKMPTTGNAGILAEYFSTDGLTEAELKALNEIEALWNSKEPEVREKIRSSIANLSEEEATWLVESFTDSEGNLDYEGMVARLISPEKLGKSFGARLQAALGTMGTIEIDDMGTITIKTDTLKGEDFVIDLNGQELTDEYEAAIVKKLNEQLNKEGLEAYDIVMDAGKATVKVKNLNAAVSKMLSQGNWEADDKGNKTLTIPIDEQQNIKLSYKVGSDNFVIENTDGLSDEELKKAIAKHFKVGEGDVNLGEKEGVSVPVTVDFTNQKTSEDIIAEILTNWNDNGITFTANTEGFEEVQKLIEDIEKEHIVPFKAVFTNGQGEDPNSNPGEGSEEGNDKNPKNNDNKNSETDPTVAIDALQQQIAENQARIGTLVNENEQLNSQLSDAEIAKANLEKQKAILITEKADLEEQITTLTSTKADLDEQITTLTTDKANLEEQIATLTATKEENSNTIAHLESSIADQTTTITELQTTINAKDAEINELKAANEQLKAELSKGIKGLSAEQAQDYVKTAQPYEQQASEASDLVANILGQLYDGLSEARGDQPKLLAYVSPPDDNNQELFCADLLSEKGIVARELITNYMGDYYSKGYFDTPEYDGFKTAFFTDGSFQFPAPDKEGIATMQEYATIFQTIFSNEGIIGMEITGMEEAAATAETLIDSFVAYEEGVVATIATEGEETASSELQDLQDQADALSTNPYVIIVRTKYETEGTPPDLPSDDSGFSDHPSQATGSMNGLALADGSVGRLYSGAQLANKTLVGELGPEMAVFDGQYHMLGANGAEFVDLPSDAIVFNHLQTQGILKGQMNIRGKAMADGNVSGRALASGSSGVSAALAAVQRAKSVWQGLLNDLTAADLVGAASGGGGGGNEAVIEDLEEWYNLSRQIAYLEQEINNLLAERANIETANGEAYLRSLREEQALINEQIAAQETLLEYQKAQQTREKNEILDDDIWSQFLTFNEDGVLQYIEGNEATGQEGALKVLADLNEKSGDDQVAFLEELGYSYTDNDGNVLEGSELVTQFYEDLQEVIDEYDALTDTVHETEEELEGLETSLNDIEAAIEENQEDLESDIYDIIVEAWEEEIEAMEEHKDLVEEANEAYVQGLNDALDAERDQYDEDSETADREELQRQLSLLYRSGGSASEIADLEEQLDDTLKEEYFDRQEDMIADIEDANEKQVEKLEQQIQLQKDALEYQKEHGLIWQQVAEIMSGTKDEILDFMMGNKTEFFTQSTLQQENMLEDWAKKVGIYTEDRQYQNYLDQAEGKLSSQWKTDALKDYKATYNKLDQAGKDEINTAFEEAYANAMLKTDKTGAEAEAEAIAAGNKAAAAKLKTKKTEAENSSSNSSSSTSSTSGSGSGSSSTGSTTDKWYYGGYTANNEFKSGYAASRTDAIALAKKKGILTDAAGSFKVLKNSQVTPWKKWHIIGSDGKEIGKGYKSQTEANSARDQQISTLYGGWQSSLRNGGPDTAEQLKKNYYNLLNSRVQFYKKGGLVDYTGPAIVHGTPSKPEAFLNAEQTAQIQTALKATDGSGTLDSIRNTLAALNTTIKSITNVSNNTETSAINIASGAITINVEELADSYDVDTLSNDIMNRIATIASKRNTRSVNRR